MKSGTLRFQYVDLSASVSDWFDVVQIAANPLGMVENIKDLCLEFNLESLRDSESLDGGHIDIIDRRQL